MSRSTIRAAVASYFTTPAIPNLTIYTSEPRIQPSPLPVDGSGSGASAFVYIEREREYRRALGGAQGGKKEIVYEVGLVVTFRSNKSGDQAMGDYDSVVENIKSRLRADRTLGAPGVVFQAGESGTGIEIISDLPKKIGQLVEIWSVVRFTVSEWINS
jgi:hypothetical protein